MASIPYSPSTTYLDWSNRRCIVFCLPDLFVVVIAGFAEGRIQFDAAARPFGALLWLRLPASRSRRRTLQNFVLDLQLGNTFRRRRFGFGSDGHQQYSVRLNFDRFITGLGRIEQVHVHDAGHLFRLRTVDRNHSAVRMRTTQGPHDQLIGQVNVVGVLGGSRRLFETVQTTDAFANQARLCDSQANYIELQPF